MLLVFWSILSREVYFYRYYAPLLENHMNRSATVVYPKENVGVGLSLYRFGSDQGAPQQWGPGAQLMPPHIIHNLSKCHDVGARVPMRSD